MNGLEAFLGMFCGILARVMLPYFKKWRQAADSDKPIKFRYRYLVSAGFSAILSLILALLVFPSSGLPEGASFIVAFPAGWMANDVINLMVS